MYQHCKNLSSPFNRNFMQLDEKENMILKIPRETVVKKILDYIEI